MRSTKETRGPLLLPLAFIALGIALLLNNFLLLGGFNLSALWPLLLVLAGAQILLRGDLLPDAEGRTFGLTRGSIESATLEISAGEIDVNLRSMQREGRLIAGQYAADSRPELDVTDTHARLRMNRSATPWMSFADWQLGLAHDLPWQVFVSTHLGQVQLDLSEIIIQDVLAATGVGDIRVIAPLEAFGALQLRSTLGDIHFRTPDGYAARVYVQPSSLFKLHVDENRYRQADDGMYIAAGANPNQPMVDVYITGTFGDGYLT